ncbi:MAG: hypothetical protein KJ619_04700 [Candidatus Omnitrophica bacterium]|nr:hypothetical protein [Candidatus Omnitrophota bacterium]
MLIIALFILGLASRLTPHLANFSPIIAIALFSGAYLNKKYSLWLPIVLYVISDLIIGLHGVVLFTWGSVFLITLLGKRLKRNQSLVTNLSYAAISSVIFFIVTNLGVWLGGWYPRTINGLIQCYTLAIPFFRTSLVSNVFYMLVLLGTYEFVSKKVPSRKAKLALLSN